jgi:biopolymer transport protein ExbD
MPQPRTLALAFVVALRLDCALAQKHTQVEVRVLSDNTCAIDKLHIPCRDVVAKLRELGTPAEVTAHFGADKGAKYEAVASTLDSLQHPGYLGKLGYINIR